MKTLVLPKENLIRAMGPAPDLAVVELRANEDEPTGMPTLAGHFARFNEWAEIDSLWEGRFLERIMPGAFKKTIAESKDRMRILFQHGQDPQIGDKPLAPIEELGEDDEGGYYAGQLLDTGYNRELTPGLDAKLYGSSFRFSVVKEELVNKPKPSKHNPEALPERSIHEAALYEFGPVTFPAYASADAGLRSGTDDYILKTFLREPDRLRSLLRSIGVPALPDEEPGPRPTPTREAAPETPPRRFATQQEYLEWLTS